MHTNYEKKVSYKELPFSLISFTYIESNCIQEILQLFLNLINSGLILLIFYYYGIHLSYIVMVKIPKII